MKTKTLGMIPTTLPVIVQKKMNGNRTKKFIVEQRCDDCKKHIEKTVLALNGVNKIRWGKKTGMLVLNYNPSKITLNDVEKAIADAGHSTPNHKAKVEFYTVAPRCCKLVEDTVEERV